MNTGIQILIERMKTNPEEFATPQHGGKAKWENIVRDYYEFLEEEDKVAYQQARRKLVQSELTEVVMKKLAGADDDGVSLTSVSHNDVNPLNSYQQLRGMGQQNLRVSTQSDDSNSLYSVPSLQKSSEEGNLLSQIAKRMGRK